MNPPSIHSAKEEQRERVLQSLVLGFSTDPLGRWFLPEAIDHLKSAAIFDAFGGLAIDNGTAYATENFEGVALWLPPGIEGDEEAMAAIMQASVAEEIIEEVFAVFEAMESYHPKEPCWYLPLIAVDPFYQGKGLGSHLMKHALKRVDEDGLPAYLESSNPQNISLYERHGFEALGQIQIGGSPIVTPMIRAAR